jgi:carbamoyl-phosphate synthase small subunit
VNRAPSAPSITRWSYDRESGSIKRETNSASTQTGFRALRETPRIATSGVLTTGVKAVPPMPPRLEMLKHPPRRSSGRSLRLRAERGCELTVYPSHTPPERVLAEEPDGVFLSNGPGDPAAVPGVDALVGAFREREIPVFGICLGHQLICLGFGASTFKLLYGHRGGNHPVSNLAARRVEITSQNHGFAVRADGDRLPGAPDLVATHVNLNDSTLEGVRHRDLPILAVQYHPESAPGPHDSRYLFDEFLALMRKRR